MQMKQGSINIDELKRKINSPVLISIMLANNETGVLNPIQRNLRTYCR